MFKKLAMAAVAAMTMVGSVSAAPLVSNTSGSLNQSLIENVSHKCTYVRYCVKVHYCYDSYNNRYNCGCYEWGQRCVYKKHVYKKYHAPKVYHKPSYSTY